MEMVCQLPCLSILQTPWGHDLDENSVQASSILKPPCSSQCKDVLESVQPVAFPLFCPEEVWSSNLSSSFTCNQVHLVRGA